MNNVFCYGEVKYKRSVRSFIKPHQKLNAALKARKTDKANFPGLTWDRLAELVSTHLQRPVMGGTLRQMGSSGRGLRGDVITAVEDVLFLGHGFLTNGREEDPPALLSGQSSTILTGTTTVRGLVVTVKIYRGGSTSMWLLADDDVEEQVIYRFPGEETTYVKIADGSLLSSGVAPSQIVKFSRRTDPIMNRMLLVRNRADIKLHAIRRYEPAENAYVDPAGREEPLNVNDWCTVGVATDLHAPDGIHI